MSRTPTSVLSSRTLSSNRASTSGTRDDVKASWDASTSKRFSNFLSKSRKKTALGVGALAAIAASGGAFAPIAAKLGSLLGIGSASKTLGSSESAVDTGSAIGSGSSGANALSTASLGSTIGTRMSANGGNLLTTITGSIAPAVAGALSSEYANDKYFEQYRQLINEQNEYNTPANQMERFSAAGLNPNLIYGMGNNGNQITSGNPLGATPSEGIASTMSAFTQAKLANAQADNLQEATIAQRNLNSAWDIQKQQLSSNLARTNAEIAKWKTELEIENSRLQNEIKHTSNDSERLELEKRHQNNEDNITKIDAWLKQSNIALNEFNMQGSAGKEISGLVNTLDRTIKGLGEMYQNFGLPEEYNYFNRYGK